MSTLLSTTQATVTEEVQVFTFGDLTLRALLLEGEPWFVAKDVAQALGYSETAAMTRRLDEDEKMSANLAGISPTNPVVTVLSESGLYSAILGSKVEGAKAFKKWVTAEVLPAIRKTGAYQVQKSEDALVLQAFEILQARADRAEAELAVVRPKAEVFDQVLTAEHTFGFRDLAKALRDRFPINEADLRRVLREKRILTPSGPLDVYSAAIDAGWAVRRPVGSWGKRERFQVRFTTKTLTWLLERLAPLEGLTA